MQRREKTKPDLRNSFLTLAVIDEALNKARISKIFPRLVTVKSSLKHREKRKKFLCNGQVVENLPTFDCSTVQSFFILPVVFQAFCISHLFSVPFLLYIADHFDARCQCRRVNMPQTHCVFFVEYRVVRPFSNIRHENTTFKMCVSSSNYLFVDN